MEEMPSSVWYHGCSGKLRCKSYGKNYVHKTKNEQVMPADVQSGRHHNMLRHNAINTKTTAAWSVSPSVKIKVFSVSLFCHSPHSLSCSPYFFYVFGRQ